MTAAVGFFGVALGFVGAVGGLLTLAFAWQRREPARQRLALRWIALMAGGAVMATVAMEIALVGDEAWCWGHNNYSQLGVGDFVDRPAPVIR